MKITENKHVISFAAGSVRCSYFPACPRAVSGVSICWLTGRSQCQQVRETLLPRETRGC